MQYENVLVHHLTMGDGQVSRVENGYITIRFGETEKQFVYPDAFAVYLSTSDEELQKEVQPLLAQREKEKAQKTAEDKQRYADIAAARLRMKEESTKKPVRKTAVHKKAAAPEEKKPE